MQPFSARIVQRPDHVSTTSIGDRQVSADFISGHVRTRCGINPARMIKSRLAWITLSLSAGLAAAEPPRDWIEPATGHRVIRLSREPGSASLYFHQNAYTAEGDKLLISTPSGLSTVNLKTRELDLVVPSIGYRVGGSSGLEVGRKSRQVYYSRRGDTQSVIFATHLDTKVTREVARLPFFGTFGGVNADETLLVGACSDVG